MSGCEVHSSSAKKMDDARQLGARPKTGSDLSSAFADISGAAHEVTIATPDASESPPPAVVHHPISVPADQDKHDAHVQANVHKALASSTKPKVLAAGDEPLDEHPQNLKHKLEHASAVLEGKVPASKHHDPAIKAAKTHIDTAKLGVKHISTLTHEVNKKTHVEKVTEVESKKASAIAAAAASKLESTHSLHKVGKATTVDVKEAQKHLDVKKRLAESKAVKHVEAAAETTKAVSKLDHSKKVTAAHVEAATKLVDTAAKTSKPADAAATHKAASHIKDSIGDLDTHKVKTDCAFLDTVIIGSLKSMPELDAEHSCVGIGTYQDDGETKIGAIKCKPTLQGTCPTQFDTHSCQVVPLEIGNMQFKQLF